MFSTFSLIYYVIVAFLCYHFEFFVSHADMGIHMYPPHPFARQDDLAGM